MALELWLATGRSGHENARPVRPLFSDGMKWHDSKQHVVLIYLLARAGLEHTQLVSHDGNKTSEPSVTPTRGPSTQVSLHSRPRLVCRLAQRVLASQAGRVTRMRRPAKVRVGTTRHARVLLPGRPRGIKSFLPVFLPG